MEYNNIKFKFNVKFNSYGQLDLFFREIAHYLNIQYDENLKPFFKDNKDTYIIEDVSNLSDEIIEEIVSSFFDFRFDNIINVPLYKFLVLKRNNRLTVLANIHSSIFDYSSVNKFYELFNEAKANPLENNFISYYDDVNAYLNSSYFEKDSLYWKEYHTDIGEYVRYYNLQSDNDKHIEIPLEDYDFSNFLKDQNTSKFNFILSIFSLYLSRIDRTKGCFLKTSIPCDDASWSFDKDTILKIDYIKGDSFAEYLNRVNDIYSDAVKHTKVDIGYYLDEDLPYYSINDFSEFNEVFIENGEGSAFTMNVYDDYLDLIYNDDLFSESYMANMVQNIKYLIGNILNNPNQQCGEIDILSESEKDLIFKFSKGKKDSFDKEKTLAIAFRENAYKYPDIVAVDDGVNQITYGDLESSTNSIAYDLKNNYGINSGDKIAVMLPRNYHFPEIVLALNKIGAVFVPIDLEYPLNRIKHMLNICRVKHIITVKDSQPYDFDVDLIFIDDLNSSYDKVVDCECNGDDLFSILFTSGTTGLPKAVMISNSMISSSANSIKKLHPSSPGDYSGCFLKFSFTGSFMLFYSFYFAESVRLFNENECKDSLLLIKAIENQPLHDLIIHPSLGTSIYESDNDINLKYLFLVGSKLNYLPKYKEGINLVNIYGTTETSLVIANTYNKDNDSLPIGRPLNNVWTYILDENKKILPIGVPGILYISNDYLSPGYLNDSDSTDDVFVENPYSDCEDNKKMYCTGDIAFYNFDGEIEFVSRSDDQLSIRGFRVEQGEIKRVMNEFDCIEDICLDVENDVLLAYYVASSEFDINDLKEAFEKELPEYMIPSLFIELDEIPLNANGKIDKFKLKNTSRRNYDVEITDEVLREVVNGFKNVLKVDFVLPDDDFVALGGNSLSAMMLQLALKEKLNANLSSNNILELSTPENIANYIKFNPEIHRELAVDYNFDDIVPLSESQLNVYLDESIKKMGVSYNNGYKIDLGKSYSIDEIENAVYKLLDVFPVLKARVINDDGDASFSFDAEVQVRKGSMDESESFIMPFKLDKSLSRFLIVDGDKSIFLYADFHHLIFDGTSLDILLNALFAILEKKEIDFVDDGVLRQISFEKTINSTYMDSAKEFFDSMLADIDESYGLLDCVDGDDNEFEYLDEFEVDGNHLTCFLQNHGITHNQFFASVFAYTLSRFSGSSKVLFNLVEDGRGHIDLSKSVGMYVKTLPILVDCQNNDVSHYLDYASNLINSAMKYDNYPFRILAKEYDLKADILFQYSHDIFDRVFNNAKSDYKIEDLKHGLLGNQGLLENHDLVGKHGLVGKHDLIEDISFLIFNINEDKFGIRIVCSEKFSKKFIKQFANSFNAILHEITQVNQLSQINYIDSLDLKRLEELNNTENPLKYADILDAFNDNLSMNPDKILVSYDDVIYNYGEAAFIANEIAEELKYLGVNSNDNVAFLVGRSELYMLSVLGILSIGAVYVPLDENLPDERIEFILNDTASNVVIASDSTCKRVKTLTKATILNISDMIDGEISTLSNLPVVYGDLACILYTSGTTGVPKGVKVTRKSILNAVSYYEEAYGLSDDDVYGLYSTIGFDAGSLGICQSIYSGCSLAVVPESIRLDMDLLNDYFINHGVTHTMIPTQVAKLFMESVEDTSLNVLLVGGEKLGEFVNDNEYELVDGFGPTETFAFISSIKNSQKIDFSSIGFPNYNTKVYILDEEMRCVPFGAVGELYVAGFQVANGYLNRADENRRAFIDNPFEDDEDYGILYRTGDLVRFLSDGSLSIVGRSDSQVKIRGNRVELFEVESAIRELEYVDDVTVQTIKDGNNNELVAYVVLNRDFDEDVSDLICSHVSQCKPEYMVPTFVVKVENIPLTVNGKVNKGLLPEIDISSLSVEYLSPTNETEEKIINAFEVVFNQKGIGLNDSFIKLGGDSIKAIHVVLLLEKNNISCSAGDILSYKTPLLIAKNVKNLENISYDSVEGIVDLLPIQKHYFNQINDDNFMQNHVIKAGRKLNVDILQDAFDYLVNLHDMLRASYKFDGNNQIQEILPVNTRICEINEFNITDNLNDALNSIISEAVQSLNWNNLINVSLIHYGNNESYVSFVIHHLIIDGVSWSILINDLAYIYQKLENNEEINLNRSYPYKNWVEDVKELVNNISDEEKQHWIKVDNLLDDSNIKGYANDYSLTFDVDFDLNNQLMLSEEEYWALAIARAYKKTYDKNIIFNRESHGRDESLANVNETIGWFTSQYPVYLDISCENDEISLMEDIYLLKDALNGVENFGLNYQSLIYTTGELKFKHSPVTFNFLSTEFAFKNELFESYDLNLYESEEFAIGESNRTAYGVDLNIYRAGEHYIVKGSYARDTYIGDRFNEFMENIEYELMFIGDYKFDNIICPLSESQLGVYLDEKVNEKETAYSVSGSVECGSNYSIDEIKEAIYKLIDKHPILKGRVVDGEIPLLVCDGHPIIKVADDYSDLIKPFVLDKSLSRFYIVKNNEGNSIFYDMHHIINDATSLSIIKQDLNDALIGELDDKLDLGFVYASRDSFESKFKSHYKNAKKFFTDEFEDIGDVGYLLKDIDGSQGKVTIPIRDVREHVESFVGKNGITVGNFLNAVFAYTYSRFTGDNKVYYNFTENGRHDSYAKDALGMFVRTIPIIVNCQDMPIKDYLTYVSDLILESMRNGIYPFRFIANEFNLTYDVGFEYNYDLNDISNIDDENISFDDDVNIVSNLLCVINDLDDGYLVNIYHSDKFSQDTAERFAKVFKEVLVQFLDKEYLKDINYISNDDVELLDKINQTEHDLIYDDILDAFNDNLSKFPNKNLVSYNDEVYTYGQGAFIANKIAQKLIELNIGKNDCVAFLTERSPYYMFSILGILSLGAVYVPLDNALPDNRLKFIVDDVNANVVIASDETYERAKGLFEDSIILNVSAIIDEDIKTLAKLDVCYGDVDIKTLAKLDACYGDVDIKTLAKLDVCYGDVDIKTLAKLDVCYGDVAGILYTSGSTGVPKGVKITRKAVLNVAAYYCDTYGMDCSDVYGLYPSISFDAGCESLFKTIYAGACLSIVPEDIRFNMFRLNEYFISQNVTHTMITTQVGKLFVESIKETSLKYLFVGGEKLGEIESPKDYILVDEYGPTETNNFITSIKNDDKADYSSIGGLNYNSKAYVLDNEGRRVPYGGVGELYLAGYQVSNGYLNLQNETDNAFVENPFDDNDDYGLMYRTGDFVRLLPDGSFGIIGRKDNQVKIRGNRVELSEIESKIREIDFVADVTVQTLDYENDTHIVAYVVLSQEKSNFKEQISDYVMRYNPDYMVPSFIVKLDQIPLTVNGKVNRHALPNVRLNELNAEYAAPRNENERIVVEAFKKVFNQDHIGIYDDFAHFGGNSLTAIRLLSFIDDYNLTAADVLTLHTPYEIAKKINENCIDSESYNLDDGCPLNESQLNVYLDIIMSRNFDSYIIPVSMNISKEYSSDEICNAIKRIIEVHPILSMCVIEGDGIPYLVKGNQPEIIVRLDASDEFIREFKTKEFNLNDSLCRFLITDNEGSGFRLYAIFNHIVFDGLSRPIFEHDFQLILDNDEASNLIPLDYSFLTASSLSKKLSGKEGYGEAHAFFNSMLADHDEAGLLLDDVNADGPGTYSIDLNFDVELFNKFLGNYNVNENVLFTSTFAYTLSRFTGTDKVLFNIIENGRDRLKNYYAIGMFVNVVPLLVNCRQQKILSYMDYMFDLIYDAMKYDYYPFRFLANEYDLTIDILFQYKPDWFINENVNNSFDVVDMDKLLEDNSKLMSDFVCEVIQSGSRYKLRVTYSDKYCEDMVKRFSQAYNFILSQLISADDLSEINYISKEDLELLDNYNDTEHSLLYEDILDAFNDNLLKYPKNSLVSHDGVNYSYDESAFIASKIADKLRDMGVKKQDNVAFLVERSELYMFSVLGILSVGAVYVPIDDNYPDERIKLILEDSDVHVLIASDKTYLRAKFLTKEKILNISEMLSDAGNLSSLPVVYGDLACILYTSGTTGVPKGVKITRKSILNLSQYYVDFYGLDNDDVYALFASIGFDAASQAICQTFYAGACLVIVPNDIRLNMLELNDYFIENNVTHTMMTTQVGKLFIQNIEHTSLKVLTLGGEKLGNLTNDSNFKLVDGFGPTESFAFICSINNSDKISSSSVGSLNYNTKAYILDAEKRRVPCGAVGELYLAGYQISEGYLNRKEETSNAFSDNPFDDDEDYGKLYRTGDMVRILPDGSLGIVGRRDSQVKIRGNRVELSEVELVIRELDYVKDVTVQTITNGSNNQLVAYVVLSDEMESDKIDDVNDSICDYVAQNKPEFMVPSFVISLDEIPLTANGKVDKRKLPEVGIEDEEYEHPIDFIENAIARGFKEVLNVAKPISRNDKFNELGGDSISVMMLIVKLRQVNLHVSVKEVLENQSVRKIAEKVEYKLSTSNINQQSVEGYIEKTPITNYFWDLNLKNPSYFNQALYFECREKIDENILKKAMHAIVNHHDMLRAKVKDGKLYVPKENEGEFFTIDHCNLSDFNNETRRINQGIDIFNGPLIKLAIFDGEDRDYLYIVIHHLIVDGVSWRIIPEDLNLAYLQLLNNEEITLPAKTSSYQDYALAIEKYRNDKNLLKQKAYWENAYKELMNVKHTKIGEKPKKYNLIQLNYSKEKLSILFTSAVKYYNSSINGLFLSAILKSWKKVTGEDELSVRMESHGREDFDDDLLIERTVGWFSTAYPVILKCEGNNNDEIINCIEKILNGIPQNGFAYPILRGIETDEMPLLTFNYLGEMNGLKTGEMFIPMYRSDLASPISLENDFGCDLNINGFSINGEVNFELKYNNERFSEEFINHFSQGFIRTLDEFVEDCDKDDFTDDIRVFSNHPDKKNLFIIHSANFGSEFFYYLAQELKDEYSFYVIEPYNLNHLKSPLTSVEEFAEKYIEIIKSIQPEGPYYIGGFCFGGSIAHQMAIQLKKQNEKVDKLIIFDTNYIKDKELEKILIESQLLFAYKHQKGGVLNPKEIGVEEMVAQSKLVGGIWLKYEPDYYNGEVLFFKSTKKPDNLMGKLNMVYDYISSKKASGYEEFYNDEKLKIIEVPVEHNRIFSVKGLEIIVPEIIKFIDGSDSNE